MKLNHLSGFLLLFVACWVQADTFGYESHLSYIEKVSSGYEKTYREVLAQYDEHIRNHPDDVLAITEKCQFIDSYAYAESELLYFESLDDESSQCKAQIQQHPDDHPDRVLYDIAFLWGDEANEKYQQIYRHGLDDWSHQQQVRFFQWAENKQQWTDDYDATIPHTAYALTQEPQFALGAAIHELAAGNQDQALVLLEQQQANGVQDNIRLARLYADLGLMDQAEQVLADLEGEPGVNDSDLIKLNASINSGYSPTVEQITGIKDSWQGELQLQELFKHFLAHNQSQVATAIYQAWTREDFWQDPFKHHKYQLYQVSNNWVWDVQDFYALLVWMAVGVICFMIAFLFIAPVHYRGLYRRVHGRPLSTSLTQWNLKHALFLGTMFCLTGTVLTILFQHDAFYSQFFMDEELPYSTASGLNAKIYLIDAAIMVLVSLLIFKQGKSLFKVSAKGFMKAMMIAISVFVLFKLLFIAGLFVFNTFALATAFDLVHLTITDLAENYGTWAVFLTVALLTPLIEEYLFRGVLLNSFTKHISFGWANTIQAALFALIHDNPAHYIHHFFFGLIAGQFVRTQKHLYGAIMFHMINNALAVGVLVL